MHTDLIVAVTTTRVNAVREWYPFLNAITNRFPFSAAQHLQCLRRSFLRGAMNVSDRIQGVCLTAPGLLIERLIADYGRRRMRASEQCRR